MYNSEAFVIGEADLTDCHGLAIVTHTAFHKDLLWHECFRDVAEDDLIAYWEGMLSMRLKAPETQPTFKITEVATGTIVAWTCLKVPSPTVPPSYSTPDLPKGINAELWKMMWSGPAQAAFGLGYDGTKDFHRRGSHTHRDYQRQGHMRRLSEHCNTIADAASGKTYAVCREPAVPLFTSQGYELLEIRTIDNGKYDELLGRDANNYILSRMPNSKQSSI